MQTAKIFMRVSSELPTIFAQKLGEKCKLLLKQKNGVDHNKLNELRDCMRYFQQMSVTSKFEDCVAVYFGMKITDEQLTVLKLIHRTTKPWMTGHIVGVCLERIDNSNSQHKDFAESVRVLIEQLNEGEEGIGKGMQGILVKSTRTELAAKSN